MSDLDDDFVGNDNLLLLCDDDDEMEELLLQQQGGKNGARALASSSSNAAAADKDDGFNNYDDLLRQIAEAEKNPDSLSAEHKAALQRRKRQLESHQQYMEQIRNPAASRHGGAQRRGTTAGAGTHTENEYMRLRVKEDLRQRQLAAEEEARAESARKAAEVDAARSKLAAERAKKAEERAKKKNKKKAKKEEVSNGATKDAGSDESD